MSVKKSKKLIMDTEKKFDYKLRYRELSDDSINTIFLYDCTYSEAMELASSWCRLTKAVFVGLFNISL